MEVTLKSSVIMVQAIAGVSARMENRFLAAQYDMTNQSANIKVLLPAKCPGVNNTLMAIRMLLK
jgi:hypothetical protein